MFQKEQNFMKSIEVNEKNERSSDNEEIQEMREIQTVKTKDNETLTISSNTVYMCCKEKKFLNDLATSWRNILNDSSASDIIVFVKNSRHIWTHKLVFYTRCTNILLDVISNDTEFSTAKEKICWPDTDYDVALAFLEFVYCGIIDRYSKIFDSEISLSCVRTLGRKYKIHDLFTYLRQKKSKSNVVEAEHDYNTYEKGTGNVHPNVEMILNIPKLGKSFNASPKHTYNTVENIQCSQKMLLQADIKDDLHSLENNYISAKNLCVLKDEKTLMKSFDEINSRSNTLTKRETSASPDMFDDTLVMKHSNKSTVYPKDLEDSNIHILLSLIKQDADIDICSQKLLKTQNAEYSELVKDLPTCSKNMEQNIMEIDLDPESNSLKFSEIDDMHKNSLIDTPQSSKSKYIEDRSSEIIKQKSNLTLFIENIQKENAELNAVLDSNTECLIQISPRKQKNPFQIDKHDNSSQSYDNNIEQSKERLGRLTMIEQHIQSFAAKNPEFYSRLSNEHIDVEQISSHTDSLSPKIIESSHNNILNCTQNFISPDEKHMNISEQVTTVAVVCSQHSETINQSLSETFLDLKTNEEDISMYSKYMRDHKENSIAKYRTAIIRNKSDNNLSDKNISCDSMNEDDNISEAETEILTQCVLTQKDMDVIVSSDTDIESISSNIRHTVSENDDSNHENIMSHSPQQSRKKIESNKQDVENENQLLEVEKFSNPMMINMEKGKNIATKLNQDKLNTEIMSIIQKSGLNDDKKKESISSPIMISSSPDFLDNESCSPVSNMTSLFKDEFCTENVLDTSACKLRRPVKFSLNFENDIYLANVDIDKYEKPHVLEKSLSFNVLSMAELKNGNAHKCSNKNNRENIKNKGETSDDYENLDNNATFLTQNFTNIKKFQRKSLSEGHIDTNKLYNHRTTSSRVATQLQCNYIQNFGNIKMPKIIDKDVTPPPDYNNKSTPELHVSSLTMINLHN